jgi:tetrahydromethanopterin S-methyltransferase subunit C
MNIVDTLVESFNRAVADLVNALPVIIGALLILLVGMIIGRIVGKLDGRLQLLGFWLVWPSVITIIVGRAP